LIEEVGIIVAYTTMGLAPMIYNFFIAKRVAKKRRSDEVDEEACVEGAPEGAGGFTLTVPCSVSFLSSSDEGGHAVHLSVKSVHPLPLTHVKRVLRQG